jgi:pyridoxamine 5'-phosphate oxidase
MARLDDLRRDYRRGELDRDDLLDDPLEQLKYWLEDAVTAAIPEPTAATVATVDAHGLPDARVVLLRGSDDRGVWWFTNRQSAKGSQLAANARAAVVLWWEPLERQVRLRGPVELLPDEESDAYFASRPRGSRIGAWASDQSSGIADRAALEAHVAAVERRFDGVADVPRPDHWGGYLLRPTSIEFWQGRSSRLHDRLRFERPTPDDDWQLGRLQP